MITMKQYYDALLTMTQIYEQKIESSNKLDKKVRDIQTKYRDLKYKLQDRENKEVNKWLKEKEAKIEALDSQMDESVAIHDEYKTIMELFKVIQNDSENKLREPTVFNYRSGEKITYEHMGLVHTDSCSSLYVYIVSNKKPKNKFSLLLVGNTIFHGDALSCADHTLVRELYHYGVDTGHENANVVILLKDAPTEKELINYFNKNSEKLRNNYKNKLKPIQEIYEQAKELYKQKEWQIGYLEHQKDYYENYYSGGTETPEYQEVIKRLKDFAKN